MKTKLLLPRHVTAGRRDTVVTHWAVQHIKLFWMCLFLHPHPSNLSTEWFTGISGRNNSLIPFGPTAKNTQLEGTTMTCSRWLISTCVTQDLLARVLLARPFIREEPENLQGSFDLLLNNWTQEHRISFFIGKDLIRIFPSWFGRDTM